ncbi:hypothetical protein [Citrobacter sp. NCU1]|uniref:hypothetical protein n=1 Tax=Citrobacter sp. NCU1 TaxID=2026683 RepID=UPI001391E35C|nr:hypothetical protein [Citrobacter sp. NCU1]
MTGSNYKKITFSLQKKDSKASEGWQDDEGTVTGKWEVGHVYKIRKQIHDFTFDETQFY